MANILIVDDQQSKIDQLQEFIKLYFLNPKIDVAKYSSSAKRILRKQGLKYDLILLDMSFENYNNPLGKTDSGDLTGLEILQYMDWNDIIIPVIVCTGHQTFNNKSVNFDEDESEEIYDINQLNIYVKKWFENICLECFYLGGNKSKWHDELGKILKNGKF